jgi:hypothetical protein
LELSQCFVLQLQHRAPNLELGRSDALELQIPAAKHMVFCCRV